jgi:transposase
MVFESERHCGSQWEAICSVAEKLEPTAETVRKWVRRAETDSGGRPGLTTDERQRLKDLERENRELRRANEILKTASTFFAAELNCQWRSLVHQCVSGSFRGRADLHGVAVRPERLLVSQEPTAVIPIDPR